MSQHSNEMSRPVAVASWILQIVAALILVQSAAFKLTGAPETRALFEALGAEPAGRLATGLLEVLAFALLIVPRTAALGGLLAAGLMLGAVGAHLTRLGISFDGDGGALFAMAVVTLLAGAGVAWLRRARLPGLPGLRPRAATA